MSLTKVQKKILTLLSDGKPHTREEVHSCLPDDLGSLTNIKAHLTAIRKQIRPEAHDILCQIINKQTHYRLVRLIVSGDE